MRSRHPASIASQRSNCLVQEAVQLDIGTGVTEQGWQDLPIDLLEVVVARVSKPEHKAISLVCKRWNQAVRQQAVEATVYSRGIIVAALHRFPNLTDLHLHAIQDAVPVQAVQAAARHTSLRSLHLNRCSEQHGLLEALAATSKLQELHILGDRQPGQTAFNQLPFLPGLVALSLDGAGLTRRHDVLQHTGLTSLALIHQLQLPAGLLTGLDLLTALRALDLTSCKGSQPASITNASIAALLPSLVHLTRLSLSGCSTLHLRCLDLLSITCPELQHLSVASLQRRGATLHTPDGLTHLDLSDDNGAEAVYLLPPGLLRLNISNTVLGDGFARDLRVHYPNLQHVVARGCKALTSLGVYELADCRQLKKLIVDVDACGIGRTGGIAAWVLSYRRLRLATDMASDGPCLLEMWGDGVVSPHRQAEATLTLQNRMLGCGLLFTQAINPAFYAILPVAVLHLLLSLGMDDAKPLGGDFRDKAFAVIVLFGIRVYGVYGVLKPILQLARVVLGAALTPGITSSPGIQRFAWATVRRCWWTGEADVSVGRRLAGPAVTRIRNKPLARQGIPLVAATGCIGCAMAISSRYMVHFLAQARPILPYPAMVLVVMIYMSYILRLGLVGMYWVCSMAALLG